MTGRKVPAEEALRIGACERVVADGEARMAAEALAARSVPAFLPIRQIKVSFSLALLLPAC